MIRSAVPTLATIVTLASLSAARADGLFLSEWPFLSPVAPATTGVFPRLPENWSDYPFQLHISETTGYNDNIANTPNQIAGNPTASFRPIGSIVSISSYGGSFKYEVGGQQFFADGSWGVYRYLSDAHFNSDHTTIDVGDNFTYGSKCSGVLKGSLSSSPSIPGQQIGVNVINTVTTTSATENARCTITGEYSGIFNSGVTNSTNTAALDKTSDFTSEFIAAGISYTVSDTNSLQVLATITGTDYTNRQALAGTQGLVNNITTDELVATYTKNFGPNLAMSLQVGLVGFKDSGFSFGIPRTILPQYSFTAQWSLTPKLALSAAVSRHVSTPQSIISNLQLSEAATAAITYQMTPKISLGANLSASYNTAAATPVTVAGALNTFAQSQRSYAAGARLAYTITPFLGATLSYQYTKSVQSTLTTTDSSILLALNFNPY